MGEATDVGTPPKKIGWVSFCLSINTHGHHRHRGHDGRGFRTYLSLKTTRRTHLRVSSWLAPGAVTELDLDLLPRPESVLVGKLLPLARTVVFADE